MKPRVLLLCIWGCLITTSLTSSQPMQFLSDAGIFVQLDNKIVHTMGTLEGLLPDYSWSQEFKSISHSRDEEVTIASYDLVKAVIDEGLASCVLLPYNQCVPLRTALEEYQHRLLKEDELVEVFDDTQPCRKVKKICRLCVTCLNVTKHLFVNGQEITGGSQGGSFSASYGQLSVSAQDMLFFTDNEWLVIPFNATGPSSDIGASTTPPATLTIQQDGVYQINFSLYFLVEDSDENTFTPTTYTLGLNINNGVTTPVAAVYAGDPGSFSLNYSSLMEFSSNDTVQFYMEASAAEEPSFTNNVTLEDGHAHLVQISN